MLISLLFYLSVSFGLLVPRDRLHWIRGSVLLVYVEPFVLQRAIFEFSVLSRKREAYSVFTLCYRSVKNVGFVAVMMGWVICEFTYVPVLASYAPALSDTHRCQFSGHRNVNNIESL